MFVDKDQSTRRSELCWSMLSTLLASVDIALSVRAEDLSRE